MKCKEPDCASPAKNAGYCWKHYMRLRRHGDTVTILPTGPKPEHGVNITDHLRAIVIEAKSEPCDDCGQTFHFAAMDFDHRPGEIKVGTIAVLARSGNKQRLLDEMAKCDLVCSNCHRIRTWMRRVVSHSPSDSGTLEP